LGEKRISGWTVEAARRLSALNQLRRPAKPRTSRELGGAQHNAEGEFTRGITHGVTVGERGADTA